MKKKILKKTISFEQIEICADDKVYGTLWSRYVLKGKSINLRDTNGPRPGTISIKNVMRNAIRKNNVYSNIIL